MDRCRMISFEQLLEWQKQQEAFQPLPVWLEHNARYSYRDRVSYCEPAVIVTFDDVDDDLDDASAYFLGGPSFQLQSYSKSWRLWYAYGAEKPSCDEPWQLFSWDDGKGDHV